MALWKSLCLKHSGNDGGRKGVPPIVLKDSHARELSWRPPNTYLLKNAKNCVSACNCDARGSASKFCNRGSGQCVCHPGVSGRTCDRCKQGHYRYPECRACSCNGHADSCDQSTGICIQCRDNTMGDHCDV